jgi:hypothetical protein
MRNEYTCTCSIWEGVNTEMKGLTSVTGFSLDAPTKGVAGNDRRLKKCCPVQDNI